MKNLMQKYILGCLLCLATETFAQVPTVRMIVDPAKPSTVVVVLDWPGDASSLDAQITDVSRISVFYDEDLGTPTITNDNGTWTASNSFTETQISTLGTNPNNYAYEDYTVGGPTNFGDRTTATTDTLFKLTYPNPSTGRMVEMVPTVNGVGQGDLALGLTNGGFIPNMRINFDYATMAGNYTTYDATQTTSSPIQLPVDLIAFTAEPLGNKDALLQWSTASEINNNRFDIERSYDGRTFEAVGDVAGNGNSQHQIDYSYTDASVSKVEKTVYYRLKQLDFDGEYEYSAIRVVRFDAVGNNMQLVAYPNPLNNELNVMVGLSNGESYQLEVTNLQGALVHQENHVFSSGLHTLDLSQWNSGMYIVEVISDRGSEHIKVMKK